MPDPLPPDLQTRVQMLAAAGRAEIERHLSPLPFRSNAWRLAVLRAVGAVGIGVLTAGLAVLLIVVIVNLVFHYRPT